MLLAQIKPPGIVYSVVHISIALNHPLSLLTEPLITWTDALIMTRRALLPLLIMIALFVGLIPTENAFIAHIFLNGNIFHIAPGLQEKPFCQILS